MRLLTHTLTARQKQALAALSRTPLSPRAVLGAPDLALLIAAAQANGATWARIAETAGLSSAAMAKKWAKNLAGQAQRDLVTRQRMMGA